MQTQAVSINTMDAESRGIGEGDMVRVFNDRGEMIIPARVTERIMQADWGGQFIEEPAGSFRMKQNYRKVV